MNYPNKVVVNDYLEIEPGLFITGPIASEKLVEQSVVIDLKEKGLVVLVGCTHPGIKKIIDRAIEITGNSKIYGIMGGLHFIDDNAEQLTVNIDYLASLNLSFIIPMHCTGLSAMNELVKRFGKDKVVMSQSGSIGAGNYIEIEPELNLDFERRF